MDVVRVEVTPKIGNGMRDARGDLVKRQLLVDSGISDSSIDISTYITYAFYGVNGQTTPEFIASKLVGFQTTIQYPN